MYLQMAGLDHHTASTAQREAFSFSKEKQKTILKSLKSSGICAVLLSTCNRTELYLSGIEPCQPIPLLMQYANISGIDATVFYEKFEQEAALHLIEVACGLHSQVLHEEQIVTQVNQAICNARMLHTSNAVLDTLFRIAVSAGKYALTHISDKSVPLSLSEKAVRCVEQQYGSLEYASCLVIGNGKMGQLAAEQLLQRGSKVYITLRSCHNGNSVVPFGAIPVPYESRLQYLEKSEIVISATRSPHYTITAEQLQAVQHKPKYLIDLALPRDIAEDCKQVEDVCCWNLDDFSEPTEQKLALQSALQDVAEKYINDFQAWCQYRNAIPHITELKELITANLMHSTTLATAREQKDVDAAVQIAVQRTVELLLGGMRENVTPDLIAGCCKKIESHTRLPKKAVKQS